MTRPRRYKERTPNSSTGQPARDDAAVGAGAQLPPAIPVRHPPPPPIQVTLKSSSLIFFDTAGEDLKTADSTARHVSYLAEADGIICWSTPCSSCRSGQPERFGREHAEAGYTARPDRLNHRAAHPRPPRAARKPGNIYAARDHVEQGRRAQAAAGYRVAADNALCSEAISTSATGRKATMRYVPCCRTGTAAPCVGRHRRISAFLVLRAVSPR